MDTTPNLGLPYIMPAQAQKHVTHNEAIRALDALVQCAVIDRDQQGAPTAPNEGDRHIVAAGAAGSWQDHDHELAVFQDGGWLFYPPRTGWQCWSMAERKFVVWDGTLWEEADRRGPAGGGFGYSFDANVNMGDPGPGRFRLNNSTPALATTIALAPDLLNGLDVSAMLMARFSSTATIKNRVVITASGARLEYDALALTDQGGWLSAMVQNGAIAGTLSSGAACDIVFEWRGQGS